MKQNFCVLKKVTKVLFLLEKQLEDQFEISLNESMILCLLYDKPYKSSDIALHLGISNSRISRILMDVEKRKFISRSTGTRDRREMFFTLTSKGKQTVDAIQASDIEFPVISIEETKYLI